MAATVVIIFIIGYLVIAFERSLRLNKTATALMTGVLCWTVYIVCSENEELVTGQLARHLGELSQILFFLMGAMAIVELIDAHDGFEIVTSRIKTTSKPNLMWIKGLLTFFFSAGRATSLIHLQLRLRSSFIQPSELRQSHLRRAFLPDRP